MSEMGLREDFSKSNWEQKLVNFIKENMFLGGSALVAL